MLSSHFVYCFPFLLRGRGISQLFQFIAAAKQEESNSEIVFENL